MMPAKRSASQQLDQTYRAVAVNLPKNPAARVETSDGKDELVREFDLHKVNKGSAVFNRVKLDWLNREYVKTLSADRPSSEM